MKNRRIRLGIVIDEFLHLSTWELFFLDALYNSTIVDVCVVMSSTNSISDYKADNTLQKFTKGVANLAFRIQHLIESKLFDDNITFDNNKVMNQINETLRFNYHFDEELRVVDILYENEHAIKNLQLDLILDLGRYRVGSKLQKVPRYGVWRFKHSQNSSKLSFVGLTEILQHCNNISISLLSNIGKSDRIIDRSYYNINTSWYQNKLCIYRNSVHVFLKNVAKLNTKNVKLLEVDEQTPLNPSTIDFMKYLFHFYFSFIKELKEKVFRKLFGIRYNCWTLMLGDGLFIENNLSNIKPVKLPKGEFWADPFLFNHKGEDYVFFENFTVKKGIGKISCGRVINGNIEQVKDVLVKDYHLSYPFVFCEDNEIFMIPETNQAKCLEIYKCLDFPDKWELYSRGFEGDAVADSVYYKDENGIRWLFINKGADCFCNLYIYRVDSLKLNNIEDHYLNPVITDSITGRNAGAIYKQGEALIRPSQNHQKGIYGYGLNLNVINKLSLFEYEEEKILTVEPNFHKGINGIHHLHQTNKSFVVDLSFKRYSS